ncbi:MAG: class II SORL domain-containing protein [Candidatus Omnitrophica bacterium]|nr:class II SORL domain-containing protein [Candidatus Omnitrophota bacterium]MCM8769989.1 class II SORL domain-containing protein [Candidatus Omnitrophota bacterium]
MKEWIQSADWAKEKHVPVIELESATKGKVVQAKVTVGKQIPHPNTTEHHIAWIELYFQPEGSRFPYLLVRVDFATHGASTDGPNTSTVYTWPTLSCSFSTEKSGFLVALSYCNIHGLWQGSAELKLV